MTTKVENTKGEFSQQTYHLEKLKNDKEEQRLQASLLKSAVESKARELVTQRNSALQSQQDLTAK